jgi:hypothetical protein
MPILRLATRTRITRILLPIPPGEDALVLALRLC